MGNCQAAEVATVVIQHPGTKVERIYWSVSANEVMASNPGHYVALVIASLTPRTENGLPVKQLKLLRPDDALLLGHVYRLVSFEDVLKEFAAKKSVKLGKLLRESGGMVLDSAKKSSSVPNLRLVHGNSLVKLDLDDVSGLSVDSTSTGRALASGSTSSRAVGMRSHHGGGHGGQWKPALQSISEIGT